MPSQDKDLSCDATHIRETYSAESRVENGPGYGHDLLSWEELHHNGSSGNSPSYTTMRFAG